MLYDDDTEIIDIFDNSECNTPKVAIKEDTKTKEKVLKKEKKKVIKNRNRGIYTKNRYLFLGIVFIPILIFLYVVSLHSDFLINERMKAFVIVLLGIFSIVFVIGMIREVKVKRTVEKRIMKLSFSLGYMVFFLAFGLMLYGNNSSLRSFIINKAMTTTSHQYLAKWLYDEDTINDVLLEIKEDTKVSISSDKLTMDDVSYDDVIYENIYEEAVLTKENEDDIYKIIEIEGTTIGADYTYKGYLVVVYDPSKVKLGVSTGAGVDSNSYGETLATISSNYNALVAINAGGFYDPYWNSNGGIPHGAVISDGKLLTEYTRGTESGGIIGFNYDNELVLKNMTGEEAIAAGIRDAVDWGPYLIVDGVNQFANTTTYSWATSRTAIGQREDGIVLLLVIDGGNQPGSYGASYADVAKIMEQYGAVNAANLDGGTSTALVENNDYVNNPWNGYKRTIRRLPNAWIVVE